MKVLHLAALGLVLGALAAATMTVWLPVAQAISAISQ